MSEDNKDNEITTFSLKTNVRNNADFNKFNLLWKVDSK